MWQRSYFDCFEDFEGDDDATEINNTFIVLILEVVSPEELGQFRPIILCNTM
jgi:hypothetical protein